ncbi:MAG: baseplate J/gp47 family protein [bacterium]
MRIHLLGDVQAPPARRGLQWLASHPGGVTVEATDPLLPHPKVETVRIDADDLMARVSGLDAGASYRVRIGTLPTSSGRWAQADPAYSVVPIAFDHAAGGVGEPRLAELDARRPPAPTLVPASRDYAGFRKALLDRLRQTLPGWSERREADVGMAIIEILAHAADQLSFYQDAVAGEASLETAMRRSSVRRHARLLDYQMHDGISARTILQVRVDAEATLPAGTIAFNALAGNAEERAGIRGAAVTEEQFKLLEDRRDLVAFRTAQAVRLVPQANDFDIYDWGMDTCNLPAGATSVDLDGDWLAVIQPGSLLLLEEIASEDTAAGEAGALFRWVVRVRRVEPSYDPVTRRPLTAVHWDLADRLPRALDVVTRTPDGQRIHTAVASGNLVVADQGRPGQTSDGLYSASPLPLGTGPLSQAVPLDPWASVADVFDAPPHRAQPIVHLTTKHAGRERIWTWRRHLFDSGPFDNHFTVESEEDGHSVLRFGDGELGRAPAPGDRVICRYSIGMGAAGNLGADALVHIMAQPGGLELKAGPDRCPAVRNPIAARGGTDSQPLDEVRALAPLWFRTETLFAIDGAGLGRQALSHPRVQAAAADLVFDGAGQTARIAVLGKDPWRAKPNELCKSVAEWLDGVVPVGTRVHVRPPAWMPYEVHVSIVVAPGHHARDVCDAVRRALLAPKAPMGPEAWAFRNEIALSQVYVTAHGVGGVVACRATRFDIAGRSGIRDHLSAGEDEILVLEGSLEGRADGLVVRPEGESS